MRGLDKRWLAFYKLCAGELMIVLDTTVVNVALPSIQSSLGFSEAALVWVVNAYMVTYGGLLLLGGRLGDLYGRRRLFLLGTVVFTLASLACGLAGSQGMLVSARAIQGAGGAVVSAIALSLIMSLFSEPGERANEHRGLEPGRQLPGHVGALTHTERGESGRGALTRGAVLREREGAVVLVDGEPRVRRRGRPLLDEIPERRPARDEVGHAPVPPRLTRASGTRRRTPPGRRRATRSSRPCSGRRPTA